ncbi:MAG: ABC transporter permease [Dactylosporangium sp.]|nr:hypothetical protein [Dactylosporangium sp.]NNJ59661.1 ABC transporter permease [Dactylosporangium sp.]
MNLVRAEMRKLLGLPATWVASLLSLALAPAIALITTLQTRHTLAAGATIDVADLGFRDLAFGVIGPLVLGVVAVSSEYTSTGDEAPDARQLTVSLIAAPRRLRFLAAKTAALSVIVMALALSATVITITITRAAMGDYPLPRLEVTRMLAVALYWLLTALMADAITLITRNGVIPLTLLMVNTSVVSVSYLLSKVTRAAVFLPDIAGLHLFVRDIDTPIRLAPLAGGLVMASWVAVLLAIGAARFSRRDA